MGHGSVRVVIVLGVLALVGWLGACTQTRITADVMISPLSTPAPNFDADINQDGWVDLLDFSLLSAAWISRPGEDRYESCPRCDIDHNGVVADGDLELLRAQWSR